MSIEAVLAAPNGVPLTGAWVTAADRETAPETCDCESRAGSPTLCISVGGTAVLDVRVPSATRAVRSELSRNARRVCEYRPEGRRGVREQGAAQGLNESRVAGEYTPGDQIEDRDDTFMPRFLYAFWRLCEQQIAAVGQAQVNHSAQVLADRAGVSPEVRVVRLRRAQQTGGSVRGNREWQHRWVVRMHKVHQWYPRLQQHKVIYRGPYIKGPDGKPLLGGETVRALIR